MYGHGLGFPPINIIERKGTIDANKTNFLIGPLWCLLEVTTLSNVSVFGDLKFKSKLQFCLTFLCVFSHPMKKKLRILGRQIALEVYFLTVGRF